MILDAQVLLGPALVALYLKDCLCLLESDEAVLVAGRGGRWRAAFGAHRWRLAGREPYLCHPLKPYEPVFRLRWDAARASAPATGGTMRVELPRELATLAPWCVAIWLALFVLLPVAFYGHLGLTALLAGVAVTYALIAGSLWAAWRRRAALGVSRRDFAVLAFEVLACAPYAANLVRRLANLRRSDEDFLRAAERLLKRDALDAARHGCTLRVDEELEAIAEGSVRAAALRQARDRLAPRGASGGGHGGR